MPFVVTIAGFVALGADLIGARFSELPDKHQLTLRPPGSWYDEVRETRIVTGPGRAWVMPGWSRLVSGAGAA